MGSWTTQFNGAPRTIPMELTGCVAWHAVTTWALPLFFTTIARVFPNGFAPATKTGPFPGVGNKFVMPGDFFITLFQLRLILRRSGVKGIS